MTDMIFISHRGNIERRDPERENTWAYIMAAIEKGYDVEVDLWARRRAMGGIQFGLGHDAPMEEVHPSFLLNRGLWIHCKNAEAMFALHQMRRDVPHLNYFFHDKDDITYTSQGFMWTFPGKTLTPASIAVMPEDFDGNWKDIKKCAGICSDWIAEYRRKYEE